MNTKSLLTTMLIFTIFVIIYFIPAATLETFLPAVCVKYRMVVPLTILAITAFYHKFHWSLALSFVFSGLGDSMGAAKIFLAQMGFFAIAHILLIVFFSHRIHSHPAIRNRDSLIKNKLAKTIIAIVVSTALLTFSFMNIIPNAPEGIVRTGCIIYSLLICTMFICAQFQKSLIFAIGAALFLASDMILAWNKFVSPIEYSNVFIMIPYYYGQAILWIGGLLYLHTEHQKIKY